MVNGRLFVCCRTILLRLLLATEITSRSANWHFRAPTSDHHRVSLFRFCSCPLARCGDELNVNSANFFHRMAFVGNRGDRRAVKASKFTAFVDRGWDCGGAGKAKSDEQPVRVIKTTRAQVQIEVNKPLGPHGCPGGYSEVSAAGCHMCAPGFFRPPLGHLKRCLSCKRHSICYGANIKLLLSTQVQTESFKQSQLKAFAILAVPMKLHCKELQPSVFLKLQSVPV